MRALDEARSIAGASSLITECNTPDALSYLFAFAFAPGLHPDGDLNA
jgi:hypothetical protein